ncbi:hypothetical protein BGZ58_007832 [Dissophora ornata]|nr:hypothetical protein BGZ58_007832 [Dissophora ornata]
MSDDISTSTLAATFTGAIISATNTLSAPSATLTTYTVVSPTPSIHLDESAAGDDPNREMLCDWVRSAADCRDEDFIRYLLMASSAMHGFVFLFAFWLLIYRNRGLNFKIITELYTKVGTGVRPKPMDCITFFTGLASLIKIGVNIPLILDIWRNKLWLRITIEQTYWVVVAIGFSSYFVGLLYAMPVTTREGIFAVYYPETTFNARSLRPIHVLTPTTVQKNFVLLMGAIYPAIFGAGAGVASAVFAQKPGYEDISKILFTIQYSNWVLILWTMTIMFFYYGLKYTFILRANIIIAEAALRAPQAAFGISNLRSKSPARFLFIQLQITGFGGSAVTLLAGSLCMIWVLWREKILAMQEDQLPRAMAFFWTCAIALAYFVIIALIAVQTVRNRRRGLHQQASSLTNSFTHGSGQKKSSTIAKSLYSSQTHKVRPKQTDCEEPFAQRNSSDLNTLHSVNSMDKETYGATSYESPNDNYEGSTVAAILEASRHMKQDAFNVFHHASKAEHERTKKTSIGSPARPFNIMAHHTGQSTTSNATFGRRDSDVTSATSNIAPPELRSHVFGGRLMGPDSPPLSPSSMTSNSSSPSIPLITMRSSSRPHSKHGPSGEHNNNNNNTASAREIKLPASPERSNRGGEPAYRFPSVQRQQAQIHEQQPRQNLQYQASCKGLSPPPRARRLANTPRVADDPVVLPTSPMISHPVSPTRNTFMDTGADLGELPVSQYSDTPRHGGGVRRKSIKDGQEIVDSEPKWPLPPTLR